jgi:O-succinylbenzoic acid--CoA ligase
MNFILKSQSVIFDDTSFISMPHLLNEVAYVAENFRRQGISKDTVCLLTLDSPLDMLKTLLALFSLQAIAALINPKSPTYDKLCEDLGKHIVIDRIVKADTPHPKLSFDLDKISLLIPTSGSSSTPKWIAQTLTEWEKSVEGTLIALHATSYQPWILSLPLHHVSGLSIVFRALYSHAPLLITKSHAYLVNCRLSMIPLQIERLQGALDPFMKAASILIGGTKLAEETFKNICHLPIYITYGMTECCSQITCSEKSPKSLHEGRCLKHRNLFIDESEEIFISGDSTCYYFWKKGALHPLKNDNGFYPTKDLGQLSETGQLTLLSRKDERIELNGEKIYPSILDQTLKRHFEFNQLVITHIKDASQKALVVAFCDPMPEDLEGLKKACGSLFFPKYFFPLNKTTLDQKILLTDLKARAKKFIFEQVY